MSLDHRISQLEKVVELEDRRLVLVSFPTDEAYRQARDRGELPKYARVYIGIDLDAV